MKINIHNKHMIKRNCEPRSEYSQILQNNHRSNIVTFHVHLDLYGSKTNALIQKQTKFRFCTLPFVNIPVCLTII